MGTFFAKKGLIGLPPIFRRLLLICIDVILLPLAAMAELLVALGAPLSYQLRCCWQLVVMGRTPGWSTSVCINRAIQGPHPLRR